MIEIVHVRENESDNTAFFKLSVKEETVEFHGDFQKDADPKEYWEAREDYLVFLVLNKMYREADWKRFQEDDMTQLEAMLEWIAKGHKNLIGKEGNKKIYKVIKKKKWHSTHPPYIKKLRKIEESNESEELKELLKEIVIG